jgi:hypothetical protein
MSTNRDALDANLVDALTRISRALELHRSGQTPWLVLHDVVMAQTGDLRRARNRARVEARRVHRAQHADAVKGCPYCDATGRGTRAAW